MTATQHMDLLYLEGSGLELAHPADDVRGMTVVDLSGHRLGEVQELVIDTDEQRARLLSVVSGGVLGLDVSRRLIPVEAVARIDDRVHVGHVPPRSTPNVDALNDTRADQPASADLPHVAAIYDAYDVRPFWDTGRGATYFHHR